MSQYLIELPHTLDNCMPMLDSLAMDNPDFLKTINWGCMAGNHTGWAMVEAASDADASNMVPAAIRDSVCVTQLSHFTPEQVRELHMQGH
jgi:hypothetical protein